MKKLLSLLSVLTISGTVVPTLVANKPYIITVPTEKINITRLKSIPFIVYTENLNTEKEIAQEILLGLMTNNSEQDIFVDIYYSFLENNEWWNFKNVNLKNPEPGKSEEYKNATLIASVDNKNYKGAMVFDVTLTNNKNFKDVKLNTNLTNKALRYIQDRSNDPSRPNIVPVNEVIDINCGNGVTKSVIEDNFVSVDITKYASSKEEFLKYYSSIILEYDYGSNWWTDNEGWSYSGGKNIGFPLNKIVTINGNDLKNGFNNMETYNDKSNLRKGQLWHNISLEWNENIFKMKFELSGNVWWTPGTKHDHAVLGQLRNVKLTLKTSIVKYNDYNKAIVENRKLLTNKLVK